MGGERKRGRWREGESELIKIGLEYARSGETERVRQR